jgi:hypothetical protein
MERHPDIHENLRLFGCAHTHGGRVLPAPHLGASRDVQEDRLSNAAGWKHEHTKFEPVRFAIEGARAYNAKVGLPDPHEHHYDDVRQDADTVRRTGRAYDALPDDDPSSHPHFEAMRQEVANQHHHLTHTMGINVQSVDHDPYENVHAMVHDVANNRRLKVMGTHVTGGHPFFSNEENDKFRAVHDFFGHAATGRDFSRHGEQAAFLAHARMFSHHALPAMASETKGQNTSLILNGEFGPQKIAVLPKEHWNFQNYQEKADRRQRQEAGPWNNYGMGFGSSLRAAATRALRLAAKGWRPEDVEQLQAATPGGVPRFAIPTLRTAGSIRVLAHDSGDGETIFHCPFCGSGQVIARSDGAVDCEFCNTAFSVQVQPQMPSFPQTIDGVPVQVPGMPAGGENANVPAAAAPGGDPMADGDPGAEDGGFPPDGDDGGDEDGGDDKPAFLKGSYRIESGAALDADRFMRRLALQTARTPKVLAKVRRENGVS